MPESLITSGKSPSAVGGMLATAGAILAGLLAAVSVNAQPRDPSRVAAVFPPWWSVAQSVSAAGSAGRIAAVGGAPFIVILRGDPIDLAQRARSAGALLVLDPDLAGVCAPKEALS
ncbi:hypothetical protein [Caulobacter sp.]|uniref:hypothetical protein n=1 Tax=Caulobacter sp. TaxID=78 RepID=UPI003BAD2912